MNLLLWWLKGAAVTNSAHSKTPTTFDAFSLGNQALIDPSEGNSNAENAAALIGLTFGSSGSPLYNDIQVFAPGSTGFGGGGATYYDQDNLVSNDTFSIDGGADQTFDAIVVYNATITCADGTTATITANVFQDTAGSTYVLPEGGTGADYVALQAGPIRSITLDSINDLSNLGIGADRPVDNFVAPDGVVDGTTGDDTIFGGGTEAVDPLVL